MIRKLVLALAIVSLPQLGVAHGDQHKNLLSLLILFRRTGGLGPIRVK